MDDMYNHIKIQNSVKLISSSVKRIVKLKSLRRKFFKSINANNVVDSIKFTIYSDKNQKICLS